MGRATTKDEILSQLRLSQDELDRFHVKSLAVFGSAARGQLTDSSDIDILVEFSRTPTFDLYMDLKFFLEDSLKRPVDLVTRKALKPAVKPTIEREAVYVS
ncbi:MAG: nucleotidyltransferase family protein [Desulfovibrionales bacterium]